MLQSEANADTMICPYSGRLLRRGVRPLVVRFGGRSATVDLPGFYPEGNGGGVHVGDDMKAAAEAVERLKGG